MVIIKSTTVAVLGEMLRIDVSPAVGYAVPPDNPFVGQAPLDEIWAKGLRNPWRMSFDRATGDLWAGDVGQNRWEEVDLIVKGGNYGWPMREGFIKCPKCQHDKITVDVDPDGLIDPVVDYGRDLGRSVTGGYVYRGQGIPDLRHAGVRATVQQCLGSQDLGRGTEATLHCSGIQISLLYL